MNRPLIPMILRQFALFAPLSLLLGFSPVPANASPLVPVNKACFFQGLGFTGPSICFGAGQRQFMPAAFATTISSVQVIGNVSVSLCTGRVSRGTCKTFTQDRWQVPSPLHSNVKSFQVQRDFSTDAMMEVPGTQVPDLRLPLVNLQVLNLSVLSK